MDWVDPYAGFRYVTDTVSVDTAHQAEKLGACGIEAGIFGGDVDPAFYIGLAIHAGINSGISAEGNINMSNTIIQHRPVALGEILTVDGEIVAVDEVPRGQSVRTEVRFCDADGALAITANRTSLRPDPAKVGTRGAGAKAAPLVEDVGALQPGSRFSLTPDGVKAYSSEGNSIHYEPAAAQAAGFRAPIIGGGMGVHFLTAALWDVSRPISFAMDVHFRRPIFWDEPVQVYMDDVPPSVLALIKGEGKVGTEIAISDLVPV